MLQEAAAGLPARERELVATSLIGVEQLTETVHEFLDLTRIEAGELRLNLEPVHMPSLVLDVVRHAEAQAVAQGIVVRSSVAPDLPSSLAISAGFASCSTTCCRTRSSTRRAEAPFPSAAQGRPRTPGRVMWGRSSFV